MTILMIQFNNSLIKKSGDSTKEQVMINSEYIILGDCNWINKRYAKELTNDMQIDFDPPRKILIISKLFLTRLLSSKTTEAYNNDSVFG